MNTIEINIYMTDEITIDDALHLCLAALKDNERYKEHNKDDNEIVRTISIDRAVYVASLSNLSAVNLFYEHLKTPFYLENEGIIKISPHELGATIPSNPKGYYLVVFDKTKTQGFVNKTLNQSAIKEIAPIPPTWKWFDETEGIYQFGDMKYQQRGTKVRKIVFQSLMNIFHSNDEHIMSVASLEQKTGVKKKRIREEIGGINNRLRKQCELEFKGSGKGYYYIQPFVQKKELTLS